MTEGEPGGPPPSLFRVATHPAPRLDSRPPPGMVPRTGTMLRALRPATTRGCQRHDGPVPHYVPHLSQAVRRRGCPPYSAAKSLMSHAVHPSRRCVSRICSRFEGPARGARKGADGRRWARLAAAARNGLDDLDRTNKRPSTNDLPGPHASGCEAKERALGPGFRTERVGLLYPIERLDNGKLW